MKKIFFLLAIVSFLVVSCEKDEEVITNSNSSTFEPTVTLDEIEIDKEQSEKNLAKIKAFKERMESDTKEVEWLTEDEAEWLIEACANYDYVEISEAYPQYQVDTFIYLVPRSTEGISSEDLEAVYSDISEDVEGIINNLSDGGSCELHGINLELVTEPNSIMSRLELYTCLGFAGTLNSFSAANNDTWYWGKGLGKQDGTCANEDATTQLTFAINEFMQAGLNVDDYSFNDLQFTTITHLDIPTYNNAYGSRIWHVDAVDYEPEQVLNPTEMNEFLNHALYLAQYYKPSGKAIMFFVVSDGEDDWTTDHFGVIEHKADRWHTVTIGYGVPNLRDNI